MKFSGKTHQKVVTSQIFDADIDTGRLFQNSEENGCKIQNLIHETEPLFYQNRF